VVIDITAIELKSLLEHGVASLGNQGRFPQVGGLTFSYDPSKTAQVLNSSFAVTTAGERIRSLKVGNDVVVNNGVIVGSGSRTFRLVTLDFLALRGDGYPFPSALLNKTDLTTLASANLGGPASTATATLGGEQDALMKYLKSQFSTNAYNTPDTAEALDLRIQNLAVRTDTVLQ
jgi:hypothetical protein